MESKNKKQERLKEAQLKALAKMFSIKQDSNMTRVYMAIKAPNK